MKVRVVDPTPPAKPETPFVVGGVYRTPGWGHDKEYRILVKIGKDKYATFDLKTGERGITGDLTKSEMLDAFRRNEYEYVPDAELVIPRSDDK